MNYYISPFGRAENLDGDYVVAVYLVSALDYASALKKAGGFAVGQTVGTWIQVPGVSAEMIERYQGRVLSLEDVENPDGLRFIMRVAFPLDNFGNSFTMLLTSLVGNDVSTALKVKLTDLELWGNAASRFCGPQQGIADLRRLAGVKEERPLVLNMIKPCLGFTVEEGAKLFYVSAAGGVDLIKDDELLASPHYNTVAKRTAAYLKASGQAFEKTGKHTVYLPNISGPPTQLLENARAVYEAGARACLVNYIFGGLDALQELCDAFGDKLFIMGHYAGLAALSHADAGIADNVFIGTLPRLAGAHAIMTMYPNQADPRAMFQFHRTVQAQTLPMKDINKVVTTVGGGVTPVNQAFIQEELGPDIIIGIGGAIQGHPMGTTMGAESAMVAVCATSKGIPLEEAAAKHAGLKEALKLWGTVE